MRINGEEIPAKQRSESHVRAQLDCETFFLTLHEEEPVRHDETHAHPHNQFDHVLQGAMQIHVGGEVIDQSKGRPVSILGCQEHSSAAPTERTATLYLYVRPQNN